MTCVRPFVITEGFFIWPVRYFIWDRNKREALCDKAINAIYDHDFPLSLTVSDTWLLV
jgi:hypothetical protein